MKRSGKAIKWMKRGHGTLEERGSHSRIYRKTIEAIKKEGTAQTNQAKVCHNSDSLHEKQLHPETIPSSQLPRGPGPQIVYIHWHVISINQRLSHAYKWTGLNYHTVNHTRSLSSWSIFPLSTQFHVRSHKVSDVGLSHSQSLYI